MKFVLNLWRRWGKSHDWVFDGYTLGGDWVKCQRCGAIDEYLPGLHEPRGYKS